MLINELVDALGNKNSWNNIPTRRRNHQNESTQRRHLKTPKIQDEYINITHENPFNSLHHNNGGIPNNEGDGSYIYIEDNRTDLVSNTIQGINSKRRPNVVVNQNPEKKNISPKKCQVMRIMQTS